MYYRTYPAGTIIELPDGRRGTVVFNGLIGMGIKWGEHNISQDDIQGHGDLFREEIPPGYPWLPDAMLREPGSLNDGLPCVGEDYVIIKFREV